jgi:hypothetical protein
VNSSSFIQLANLTLSTLLGANLYAEADSFAEIVCEAARTTGTAGLALMDNAGNILVNQGERHQIPEIMFDGFGPEFKKNPSAASESAFRKMVGPFFSSIGVRPLDVISEIQKLEPFVNDKYILNVAIVSDKAKEIVSDKIGDSAWKWFPTTIEIAKNQISRGLGLALNHPFIEDWRTGGTPSPQTYNSTPVRPAVKKNLDGDVAVSRTPSQPVLKAINDIQNKFVNKSPPTVVLTPSEADKLKQFIIDFSGNVQYDPHSVGRLDKRGLTIDMRDQILAMFHAAKTVSSQPVGGSERYVAEVETPIAIPTSLQHLTELKNIKFQFVYVFTRPNHIVLTTVINSAGLPKKYNDVIDQVTRNGRPLLFEHFKPLQNAHPKSTISKEEYLSQLKRYRIMEQAARAERFRKSLSPV